MGCAFGSSSVPASGVSFSPPGRAAGSSGSSSFGAAVAAWALLDRDQAPRPARERVAVAAATPPVPQPQLYKELAPEDARAENAALPFSTAPIERAPPLFCCKRSFSTCRRMMLSRERML